jgi:hypothetical protein
VDTTGPTGGATNVDFFFTYVPEPRAREYYGTRSNEELITYFALPTGEFFGIACSHGTYDRDDLIIESHGDQSDDPIFPRQATQGDGRAVRLLLSRIPEEGGAFVAEELGGYRVSAGEGKRLFPDADRVIDRQAWASVKHEK